MHSPKGCAPPPCGGAAISERSWPALKAPAAPVRITTRTASSSAAAASAADSARYCRLSKALRASGRLSVRTRTPERVSSRIVSRSTRDLEQELGQRPDGLALAGPDQERVHRRRLPGLEPVGDAPLRPEQRYLVDQRVRHRRHGLALLAVEVEVLDLDGRLLVAEPHRVVVVEVLAAGAHASD